jgi:hypothetical protein
MRLTSERIDDVLVEIEVDGGGTFSATVDDEEIKGATLLELKDKLAKAIKKSKTRKPLDVSVVDLVPRTGKRAWESEIYEDGRGVVAAVLRGKHKTQGVYLLRDLEAKAFKLSSYREGASKIVRRLTPEEVAEYARLAGEADVAAKCLEDWIKARRVDVEEFCK